MVAGGLGIVNIDRSEGVLTLSSKKDVHFTGAIALNAIKYEDIVGLTTNKVTIKGVNIQAQEAMFYTLWLWKDSGHANVDIDVDSFREFVNIDVATSGKLIAGAGQWYLQTTGLNILYEDDNPPTAEGKYTLHMGLMVSAGAGKSAGVAGEVQLDVSYSPRL